MGSGVSGNYDNIGEQSQPFASSYSVTPDMTQLDIDRGVYNGKYDKNPTAKKLKDMINNGYIVSKECTKTFTYVVDMHNNIIVGERNGNGFNGKATPHPTLIGGVNPKVKMAGLIYVKNGKITGYNNVSGHFKPNIKSMGVVEKLLKKLPKDLFDGGDK